MRCTVILDGRKWGICLICVRGDGSLNVFRSCSPEDTVAHCDTYRHILEHRYKRWGDDVGRVTWNAQAIGWEETNERGRDSWEVQETWWFYQILEWDVDRYRCTQGSSAYSKIERCTIEIFALPPPPPPLLEDQHKIGTESIIRRRRRRRRRRRMRWRKIPCQIFFGQEHLPKGAAIAKRLDDCRRDD